MFIRCYRARTARIEEEPVAEQDEATANDQGERVRFEAERHMFIVDVNVGLQVNIRKILKFWVLLAEFREFM